MQHMGAEEPRSDCIELRAPSHEKALLAWAAERTEHIILSERDTLQVLELLENPPPANTKLIAAVKAWQDNQKKSDAQWP